MKKSAYRVLLPVVLAGLVASCSRYSYYTAGLNRTNMSEYRTFAWLQGDGKGNAVNPAADLQIKDAAVAALVSKGLRLQPRNPDLLVTYTSTVGRGAKTVYSPTYYGAGYYPGPAFGFGWGWGWGWGYRPYYAFGMPYAYYGGYSAVDKEHFKEGTLIIDLIDTRSRKVVWRGFGVSEVRRNPRKDIEKLPKEVNGIIAQLDLSPPATR